MILKPPACPSLPSSPSHSSPCIPPQGLAGVPWRADGDINSDFPAPALVLIGLRTALCGVPFPGLVPPATNAIITLAHQDFNWRLSSVIQRRLDSDLRPGGHALFSILLRYDAGSVRVAASSLKRNPIVAPLPHAFPSSPHIARMGVRAQHVAPWASLGF